MLALPKKKLGLLLIAAILLFSMPAFIYVATVQQDNRIRAAKKDLTCVPIATGAGISTDKENRSVAQTVTELKKTQTSLTGLLNRYQSINGSTPEIKQRIRQTANARKKLLAQTMRQDPNTALAILENDKTLEKSLTNATSNCAAVPTTVQGELFVGHADFADRGTYYYSVTPKDKKEVTIHPAGTLKNVLLSGMQVRAKGYVLDRDMLINTEVNDSLVTPAQAAGVDHAQGEQKTVVIVNGSALTKDSVNKHVFTTVNDYYKETSYGKISITGETSGPYAVGDAGCDGTLIPLNTQNIISAADADTDFSGVSRIVIFSPFTCGWGGYGIMGPATTYKTNEGSGPFSVAWISSSSQPLTGIVAHELGHNFGVDHAATVVCGSPDCTGLVEYGNPYNVMGGFLNFGQMGSPHRDFIGWFDDNNIKTVSESGTYEIAPIENEGTGLKALKIPRGGDDFMYIEYRQPIGFDKNFEKLSGTNVYDGALLQVLLKANKPALFNPNRSGTGFMKAVLLPNESFTDPETQTVIKVTDVTDDKLTVDIEYQGPDVAPDPDDEKPGDATPTPDPCELTTDPDNDPGTDEPDQSQEPKDPDSDTNPPQDRDSTRNDQKSLRDRILERIRDAFKRPSGTIPTPAIKKPVIPTPRPPVINFPDWFPFNRNNNPQTPPEDLGEKIQQDVKNKIKNNQNNQQDLGDKIRSNIPTPRKPQISVSVRKPSLPNTKQIVEDRLKEAGIQAVSNTGSTLDEPCDPTPTQDPEDDSSLPTPTKTPVEPTESSINPSQAVRLTLGVTVRDGDEKAVQGTSVTLNNGSAGGCTTDRFGVCVFTIRRPGQYSMYASKNGYNPGRRTVNVQKDVKTEIRILKKSSANPTKPMNSDQPVGPQSVSVSILVYNDIIDCYSDTNTPRACDDTKRARADLNNDGNVNQIDYNIFLNQIRNN